MREPCRERRVEPSVPGPQKEPPRCFTLERVSTYSPPSAHRSSLRRESRRSRGATHPRPSELRALSEPRGGPQAHLAVGVVPIQPQVACADAGATEHRPEVIEGQLEPLVGAPNALYDQTVRPNPLRKHESVTSDPAALPVIARLPSEPIIRPRRSAVSPPVGPSSGLAMLTPSRTRRNRSRPSRSGGRR